MPAVWRLMECKPTLSCVVEIHMEDIGLYNSIVSVSQRKKTGKLGRQSMVENGELVYNIYLTTLGFPHAWPHWIDSMS